ncbi:MAG: FAD-dependent monooxygenase [Desulfobacterales bacterium]
MQLYKNKKFDVIVIGSGPGGATVAKELSSRGKGVLILEKGGGNPITFLRLGISRRTLEEQIR